jgi:hypothetical protein
LLWRPGETFDDEARVVILTARLSRHGPPHGYLIGDIGLALVPTHADEYKRRAVALRSPFCTTTM